MFYSGEWRVCSMSTQFSTDYWSVLMNNLNMRNSNIFICKTGFLFLQREFLWKFCWITLNYFSQTYTQFSGHIILMIKPRSLKKGFCFLRPCVKHISLRNSLRASSPIWVSEASLARTYPSLACSREAHFAGLNRRACSQVKLAGYLRNSRHFATNLDQSCNSLYGFPGDCCRVRDT